MAIRTYQSFSGYIATEPSTEPTRDGTPRFYARAGQRQARREPDGTVTKLPTQYMPISALGDAAEEAAALLAKGDSFTAEGRIRAVKYEKDGKTIEGEEFEVWKIGRRRNDTDRSVQAPQIVSESPALPGVDRREIPSEFSAPRSSARPAPSRAM
jgi:single-stranded DNA-binding protein